MQSTIPMTSSVELPGYESLKEKIATMTPGFRWNSKAIPQHYGRSPIRGCKSMQHGGPEICYIFLEVMFDRSLIPPLQMLDGSFA